MVAERSWGTLAVAGVLNTCVSKTFTPSAQSEMRQSAPTRTHSALQVCHQLMVIGPLSVFGLERTQIQFGSTSLRSSAF